MNCRSCGGACKELGDGKYRCKFCGSTFSESDVSASVKSTQNVVNRSDEGVGVFENNINGILEIRWQDSRYTHSGSGLLVSAAGYAVTNVHVVTHEDGTSCGSVTARIKGENITASVVALADDRHGLGSGEDLALIKLSRLPMGAKVLELENFDNVRIGEQVFVIGNSLGQGTCITGGIVSDRSRYVNGKLRLMTDCAINGGNSGGPIFNAKGKVIGVIVASALTQSGENAEGMNYAIPSSTVRQFLSGRI